MKNEKNVQTSSFFVQLPFNSASSRAMTSCESSSYAAEPELYLS
jgi:hypothetical protein